MTNKEYTVGWICAISTENVAAVALLDKKHDNPEYHQDPSDYNAYTLGEIGKHKVVIAVLPDGEYGTTAATGVAKDMLRTFPNIRVGLMVGIGGGAPSAKNDIRLGDVVVSSPLGGRGGVIQYDFGKTIQNQEFAMIGYLNQPPTSLRTAVNKLKTKHEIEGHTIEEMIDATLQARKKLKKRYSRPDKVSDRLYLSDFVHEDGSCCGRETPDGEEEEKEHLVLRDDRDQEEDDPVIHYGLIASANSLMKNALVRDGLSREHNVLCFEMEAAGLMNQFPCLVIRGICDYSDSHKNKEWQGYAAMAAAAYAKELLYQIPSSQIEAEKKINDIVQTVQDTVKRTEETMNDISGYQKRSADRFVLDWLTDVDYGVRHSDIFRGYRKNTGQWLLESEEFKSWATGDKGTIFCPGIPGAGKTILTSVVVNHLLNTFREDKAYGIAFIYFNYKETSNQTFERLISGLVKQLCEPLFPLPEELNRLYHYHRPRRTQPSLEELVAILRQTVSRYSKVYLIFDALDECQSVHRKTLLRSITEIQKVANVNTFATSRFNPDIERWFEEDARLEILATEEDIREYCRGRIKNMPDFVRRNPELQGEVISAIAQAVHGMFLLARLYLDSLNGVTSVKGIRQSMKALDTGEDAYDVAYEDAMRRIDGQLEPIASLAREMFLWITYAKRPLTETELRHALSVEVDTPEFDETNIVAIDLVSLCAGLVIIDEESRTVRLVHYTAESFFQRQIPKLFPNGHEHLANVCITYMSYARFITEYENPLHPRKDPVDKIRDRDSISDEESQSEVPSSDEEDSGDDGPNNGYSADEKSNDVNWDLIFKQMPWHILKYFMRLQQDYPLYHYAATHWGVHAVLVCKDSTANERILSFLREPKLVETSSIVRSFRYMNIEIVKQRQLDVYSALRLAASFGLRSALESLCDDADFIDYEYFKSLHEAVQNGHRSCVQLLIDRGANFESENGRGYTPLAMATAFGHEDIVDLLIEKGVMVDEEYLTYTPLQTAIIANQDAMVHYLIEKRGASVEGIDNCGTGPLHCAVERGREAIVRYLVEMGAPMEGTDWFDRTPLYNAIEGNHETIVHYLVEMGASVNAQDLDGRTPLFEAARKDEACIARYLAERGASINHLDKYGETPLLMAAIDRKKNTFRALIEMGASVEIPNTTEGFLFQRARAYGKLSRKDTSELIHIAHAAHKESRQESGLLFAAASLGDKAIVREIVESGAVVERQNRDGETPLFIAASQGNTAIACYLFHQGASISTPNNNGETPLFQAANNGHKSTANFLINMGAPTDTLTSSGQTPLMAAASQDHETVMYQLVNSGVEINKMDNDGETALSLAVRNRHKRIVRFLAEQGASVDTSNDEGCTPLMIASASGHEEIISQLLSHGASVELANQDGDAALAVAIREGHEGAARKLLHHGASIEARNKTGATALFYAAACDNGEGVIRFLLDNGALIEACDKSGETPLFWAAFYNIEQNVRLLLESGASWVVRDIDGQTCLEMAIWENSEEAERVLLDYGATIPSDVLGLQLLFMDD